MTAVIDYDAGNIKSVLNAVERLGGSYKLTREPREILDAKRVILPGVGAFGEAMKRLEEYGLIPVIKQVCSEGKPFLGICLGLQLLFEDSEESPGIEGLGILKGHIKKIPEGEYSKIPHMGWNSLRLYNDGRLFKGIAHEPYVYFVHSYFLEASDRGIVTAVTDYNAKIDASVEQGNIFACQFHPEKSGETGLSILKNFLEL